MTAGQTARNVLAAACVLGLGYLAWLLRDVLLLVVLAVFVAVALSAPVNFLQARLRLPRALAILVVYLLLGLLIVLVGLLVVPPLIDEFDELVRAMPGLRPRGAGSPGCSSAGTTSTGSLSKLESAAAILPSFAGTALSELEAVTVGALERVVELIAILAVAFLLLLDAPRLLNFLYSQVVPDASSRRAGWRARRAGGRRLRRRRLRRRRAGRRGRLRGDDGARASRSRSRWRCRWRSSRCCPLVGSIDRRGRDRLRRRLRRVGDRADLGRVLDRLPADRDARARPARLPQGGRPEPGARDPLRAGRRDAAGHPRRAARHPGGSDHPDPPARVVAGAAQRAQAGRAIGGRAGDSAGA